MSFGFLFFCWNNTQQSKPSEAIRGSLDGLLTGTLSSLLPSCLHFFGRGYSTQRFLESQTKRYEYECMHFFPLLYTAFFGTDIVHKKSSPTAQLCPKAFWLLKDLTIYNTANISSISPFSRVPVLKYLRCIYVCVFSSQDERWSGVE